MYFDTYPNDSTGLDRSGKSTQCARLAARLEAAGKLVKSVKFPGEYLFTWTHCF